ncbi:S8 family serine peptidase [Candidatus Roizmanbacteria bacterium]|nr:S8 family serine peptidase [Candidatus Roizmanbacteria bacterium]
MKRIILFLLAFSIFLFSATAASAQGNKPVDPSAQYVEGEILVKYKPDVADALFESGALGTPEQKSWFNSIADWWNSLFSSSRVQTRQTQQTYEKLKEELGITSQEGLLGPQTTSSAKTIQLQSFNPKDPLEDVYKITFTKGGMEEAVKKMQESGLVEYAQPNFRYRFKANTPNDPQFPKQWGHKQIKLEEAWEITTGSNDVIVAIVDTGVDYTHEDLAANIWTGQVNGKETHGWDFINNDGDPLDTHGHGTSLAGIIAAVGNNGIGITGVNWSTKIMAVQVGDKSYLTTETIVQGIKFAADQGADIINLSLGKPTISCYTAVGEYDDPTSTNVISYAVREQGVFIVIASGNESINGACDVPANHPDILTVTAVDMQGKPTSYSNYGPFAWKETKIIAAPSGNVSSDKCTSQNCILTTKPGGGYWSLSGTSIAAPYVAGVAALVIAKDPQMRDNPFKLREWLVKTADEIPNSDFTSEKNPYIAGDDGKRTYGKRINAYKAVAAQSGESAVPTATPVEEPQPTQAAQDGTTPTVAPQTTQPPEPTSSAQPSQPIGGNPACRPMSSIQITDMQGNDLGTVIPRGKDYLCKVTTNAVNKWTTCGLALNNNWPLDHCRLGKGYGYQRWTGNTVSFKCNTKCALDKNCQQDLLPDNGSYKLVAFDFSSICGPYQQGRVIEKPVTLSGQTPLPTFTPTQPGVPTPTPTSASSATNTPKPSSTPTVNMCQFGDAQDCSLACDTSCKATNDALTCWICVTPTPTPQGSTGQPTVSIQTVIDAVSEDKIKEYLLNLVDDDTIDGQDEKQTRYTGTEGNATERDYSKTHFESLGLEVQLQDASGVQNGYGSATCPQDVSLTNVIATLVGKNPNETYMVIAHRDSTAARSGTHDPAPGADDNGTGIATIMELARVLSGVKNTLQSSITFALFDGEEEGLCGSSFYVAHKPTNTQIKGVINLDMTGYDYPDTQDSCMGFIYKNYNGGNLLSEKIVAINQQYNLGLSAFSFSGSGDSDQINFWNEGIPAIIGTECNPTENWVANPNAHTINDKTDALSWNQITATTKAVAGALASLAGISSTGDQQQPVPSPTQTPTAAPQQQEPSTDLSADEQEVLQLINQERAKRKLSQLTLNDSLIKAAKWFSNDQSTHNFCSRNHIGSDGSTMGSRFQRFGFNGIGMGEIMSCGTGSPQVSVTGWINSPGHNKIMFDSSFTRIGVGTAGSGMSLRRIVTFGR